MVEKTN